MYYKGLIVLFFEIGKINLFLMFSLLGVFLDEIFMYGKKIKI